MEETRQMRILREIMGSDEEFFDKFLHDLSDEELENFLKENPDFLKD